MATIYISRKKGAKPPILQEKTAAAGTSNINVLPDSGYDGLAKVIVQPTPSQSKSATPSTTAQTITPDSGKLLSSVEVAAIQTESKTETAGTAAKTVTPSSGKYLSSVTINPTPSQAKTSTPNTSTNKEITPDSGYLLEKVTIQPFSHSGTYTPAANTAQNDMGAYHDKRYVNTSGMIVPSGAKSITANGTGIDVSSYATANVNVPNPTLSGNATAADVANGKTFYNNTYTKQTGSYVAPTINNITPSNSSPVSMTANNNYKPSANGYAISSYTSISTAELDSGVYFSSGIKKMASSGYAYSSQPSPDYSMTLLGSFTLASTSQTSKTLSTSLAGYNYIIISQYALSNSYFGNAANVDNCGVCGAPVTYFKSNSIKMVYRSNNGNGNTVFTYVSDTSMTVKANYSNSRTYYVYGMK